MRRVGRGDPSPHLTRTPVAAFDAKTAPVLSARLLGTPTQADQDKNHPTRLAHMAPGAFGAAIDAANGDVGSKFAWLLAAKGMACTVASVALAKRSGTPGLAADGAGNHRRLSQPRQIAMTAVPSNPRSRNNTLTRILKVSLTCRSKSSNTVTVFSSGRTKRTASVKRVSFTIT